MSQFGWLGVSMRHTKKRNKTKEQQRSKDYTGETSPYWESLENKGDYHQDHGANEPMEANPDVIGEDQGIYYVKTDMDEDLMAQFKAALPFLTEKQKQVIQLLGYEGKTLASVGAIMNISRGNVMDILKRARKIIKQKRKNI